MLDADRIDLKTRLHNTALVVVELTATMSILVRLAKRQLTVNEMALELMVAQRKRVDRLRNAIAWLTLSVFALALTVVLQFFR